MSTKTDQLKTTPETQQEKFVVMDENRSSYRKIVRQDRHSVLPGKCFARIEDHHLEITNISNFGLAIIAAEPIKERIIDLFASSDAILTSIFFNDFEVQKVMLRLARVTKQPDSVFDEVLIAFEATSDVIATDSIKALELADEAISSCRESALTISKIPSEFRAIVFEMKEFLTQLKSKIDAIEVIAPQNNADENRNFREAIAVSISEFLSREIPLKYQMIPKSLVGADSRTTELAAQFIRSQIGPLIFGAPFAHRAYNKPLGYAGDFEMMNHLYRNEMIGSVLFDQCMHKYFIDEPAGQAVKNRAYYLLEKIKRTIATSRNETVRILAIASGPAMEIQLFLKDFRPIPGKKVEFVCVDQDSDSLKHAQRQILSAERLRSTGCGFKFINLAIKNILKEGLFEGQFDLVYSAGLFDYFTDPVAEMAGKKLMASVGAGGKLIIGNFSTDNPTRALMEIVLEWHLIYRSREDMQRLFSHLGRSIEIEQEKLGINLFAVMEKAEE